MENHPIKQMLETTMGKIKEMVDANTIIGDPITAGDGTTIIPVSQVSFGFGSGGSDFSSKNTAAPTPNFGGGGGAGVSIVPVLFLVVGKDGVRTIPVDTKPDVTDKVISALPSIIDTVKKAFKKEEKEDNFGENI